MQPSKTILYIDGENFLFGMTDALRRAKRIKHKSEITALNFGPLKDALAAYQPTEIRYYTAKASVYDESPELQEESETLVATQKQLMSALQAQGIEFIMSGHMRLREVVRDKQGRVTGGVFREKSTDVRIAVDMVAAAADKELGTALILSSDSDMQPAIAELKRRQVKVVYVGFDRLPNIGLRRSTDATILLKRDQVTAMWDGREMTTVASRS
ncbi:NYN domain-containing protein [Candidatus Microgenomates bacterium]|nr:NYN domain-containing protein [Candidatus Microgenomates bacterium]